VMDKPERWIRLSSINSKYDMNNNKIRWLFILWIYI
jgi:hypothetical protein